MHITSKHLAAKNNYGEKDNYLLIKKKRLNDVICILYA